MKNRAISFLIFSLLSLIPGMASKSEGLFIVGWYAALFFLGGSIGTLASFIKLMRYRKLWLSELRIGDRVFVKVPNRGTLREGNIGQFNKTNATVYVEQEPVRNDKNEVVHVDKTPVETLMKNVFPTQPFLDSQPTFNPLWR